MSKFMRFFVIAIILAGLVGGLVAAFIWISGGDAEPSQDVNEALDAQIAAENVADEAEASAAEGTLTTFRIVTEESEARFSLQEDLRGQRVTVVGTTLEVAGELQIDREMPANTQMSTILVNVRPLRTDNEFRDRAIRGQILNSNQEEYEFVTFVPETLAGLPETVTIGEPFSFQITGQMTVRDITREETFTATVTPISETRIEGTATTEVLRSNYDLIIPEVPSVANVTDEVQLEIEFAAEAAAPAEEG